MSNDFVKSADEVAKVLKVLSHPSRLLVLCYLSEKEMSAGELVAKSNLSFSAFSQHLAILRRAELIKTRRHAQTIYYSIADMAILKVLLVLKELYCDNGVT